MKRLNRAIELLEQGQPIYYTGVGEPTYYGGIKASQTWADYIIFEMEHEMYNIRALDEFMRGLTAGGPTRSGHRTPAVLVTLPTDGTDESVIRANAWMIKQVLARGIHGILLCHVESPGAAKALVESVRYPFHTIGVGDGVNTGRRGNGGQGNAASIWGISVEEYFQKADVWPLNPDGEIMLGLKIENRRALTNAEATVAVSGIAFAEWGPGDMAFSFGYRDRPSPYPEELQHARTRVLSACKSANVAFLDGVTPHNVIDKIEEGVRVCAGGEESAEVGRKHTNREMPW